MPYTVGPNGEPVWVDATPDRVPAPAAPPAGDGSTLNPALENQQAGRKVQLVDKRGALFDVDETGAEAAIASGEYSLASPDQVQQWDSRGEREGAVATLKTFGEAAVATAFDTLTAPLQAVGVDMSGRRLIENIVGGTALQGSDGKWIQGDETQAYAARARQRAEDNPLAHGAGVLTGTVAGGLGAGKVAAGAAESAGLGRVAQATAAGVASGAVEGVGAAREEAYFENRDLTAEQMLAAMGWGALIGGGVGFAVGGAGRLFSREASRGATPFDSPRVPGASAADDVVDDVVDAVPEAAPPPPTPLVDNEFAATAKNYDTASAGAESFLKARPEAEDLRSYLTAENGNELYKQINGQLRGELAPDEALTKKIEAIQRVLTEARNAGHGVEGAVYRAAGMPQEFVEQLEQAAAKGGVVESKGFASTSTNRDSALFFSGAQKKGEIPTLLRIRQKSGVPVASLGDTPGEAEVLLPHGTRFRVIGESRLSPDVDDSVLWETRVFDLEEVTAPTAAKAAAKAPPGGPLLADDLPMVDVPGAGGAAKPAAGERFGRWLRSFSEERVTKALGARGSDIRKLGRTAEKAETEMRRMSRDVLEGKLDDGTPIFRATQSQDELVSNLVRAREEAGAALGKFREDVGRYIDDSAPDLRPKPQQLAARIEQEVIAPLERSAVPQMRQRANDVRGVLDGLRALGDDVSLEELTRVRKDLANVIYPKPVGPGLPPMPPAAAAELQKAERIIEDALEVTIDKAATKMGGESVGRYGELKAKFRSFREAAQIAGKADLQDLGNRVVSPSDYITGAAVLAGDAASGGLATAVKAAAATALHKGIREHSSAVLAVLADRLAQTVERKTAKSLDGFFGRALATANKAQPANDVTRQARRVPRAATAAAAATPLAFFMGREKDRHEAYRKRVKEVLDANAEFGTRVRHRTEAALGDLPSKAPKLSQAFTVAATRGAQFLATKIPAPLVNAQSLFPSRPPDISEPELNKFARYWSAVASPVSVLEDFRMGRLTAEQVEAVRTVYPQLYQSICMKVVDRLRELDAKGAFVPYQARMQLDTLLGLNGAGEPTARGDFIARFQQMSAQQPGGQGQKPSTPARPVNISSRLRSGRDALDPSIPAT